MFVGGRVTAGDGREEGRLEIRSLIFGDLFDD